tara:strand:+ start:856 stop:1365 length:510 start_codon:yes stop_codon:yes gene_type:complete
MTKRRRGATISQNTPKDSSVAEEALENSEVEDGAESEVENKRASLSDLKSLIFLGKVSKVIEIGGYSFLLHTLTSGEQRTLVERIMLLNEAERFARVRDFTMAQALDSVNGVNLENLYEGDSEDGTSIFSRKLSVVSNWQASLVDNLYLKYQELVDQANKEYGIDDLKE